MFKAVSALCRFVRGGAKYPKQSTRQGHLSATVRVTLKHRARVYRDGAFMVFLSLHPDHDSAYSESAGEDVTGHPAKTQNS